MKNVTSFICFFLLIIGCMSKEQAYRLPDVEAPAASIKPYEIVSKHGHVRIDNYYWLNDREDQNVIDYLTAENNYLDTMMAHTRSFQE